MDGRLAVALLTIVAPVVLIGVTIYRFSSNPVALLGLLATIVAGVAYLLTYSETFGVAHAGA